jgi:hypothetical protein
LKASPPCLGANVDACMICRLTVDIFDTLASFNCDENRIALLRCQVFTILRNKIELSKSLRTQLSKMSNFSVLKTEQKIGHFVSRTNGGSLLSLCVTKIVLTEYFLRRLTTHLLTLQLQGPYCASRKLHHLLIALR